MDVTKELELIDARNWKKPALKTAATNIVLALKAITDYAQSANRNLDEITAGELLENIVQVDRVEADGQLKEAHATQLEKAFDSLERAYQSLDKAEAFLAAQIAREEAARQRIAALRQRRNPTPIVEVVEEVVG